MAIFLSFVSLFAWGASDFFGGVASKREDTLTVSLNREWVELIGILVVSLVFVPGTPHPKDVALGAIAGVIASFSLPTFFKLLATGRMGIVAPVTGTVGATVPVIAGLISGERPSPVQIAGMVLALCAIGLISMVSEPDGVEGSTKTSRDIPKAVLSGLGFGCYYVLIHHTSKSSGMWPNVMVSVLMVLILGTQAIVSKKRWIVKRAVLPVNLLGASFDFVAFVVFTFATRDGLLSITSSISSLYPIVTAALGVVLLHERLDRLHKSGLAVSIVSLIMISAG